MTNPFEEKLRSGQKPSNPERLKVIFDILGGVNKAAATAKEARDLLDQVFSMVENSGSEESMSVGSLDSLDTIHRAHDVVRYRVYKGHILFIGDNGAIEVRERSEGHINLNDNPELDLRSSKDLKLTFRKAGSDGNFVW